jgi:alkylhydroperoxidase/carboxymuconolactone decarboxylase family protein YurZ
MTDLRDSEDPVSLLRMWDVPRHLIDDFERLRDSALNASLVPMSIIHLGLAFAYSNRGMNDAAVLHGNSALKAGLTRPQAVEGILAGVLSRGMGMLSANIWIAKEAPAGDWPDRAPTEDMDTEAILAYFSSHFGEVPGWLDMLSSTSPPTLDAYFNLRSPVLQDGALLRKHKELLFVIVNAVERYEVAMRIHMQGAIDAGASREELLEAMRAAIVGGGLVAWVAAAETAAPILKSLE